MLIEKNQINREELFKQALNLFNEEITFEFDLPEVTGFQKIKNEIQLTKELYKLSRKIKPLIKEVRHGDIHESSDKRNELIDEITQYIQEFFINMDEKHILFEDKYFTFFTDYKYFENLSVLIKKTIETERLLDAFEIFQASTNATIMYSFQLFNEQSLKLTPSIYALSNLYPYTDNIVDSNDLPSHQIKDFNYRIENFIQNGEFIPKNYIEKRILDLSQLIEGEYKDSQNAVKIRTLLYYIQVAQTDDYNLNFEQANDQEIFRASIEKGGLTVIADNYLVSDFAKQSDEQFAYNSGAFLQLLDDLADIKDDRENNQKTPFTIRNSHLDQEVLQLLNFIYKNNQMIEGEASSRMQLKQTIVRSLTLAILIVIARSPDIISDDFRKHLEKYLPVRMAYVRNILKVVK